MSIKPKLEVVPDDTSFPEDEADGWDWGLVPDDDLPTEPPLQFYETEYYDRVMVGPGSLGFYDVCCWFNTRIPDSYAVVGQPFRVRTHWALRLRKIK